MSTVVKMLKGEIDVDNEKITKPGLLTELMALKSSSKDDPQASASGSQDKSSSFQTTDVTRATMTFSSMYDRSN